MNYIVIKYYIYNDFPSRLLGEVRNISDMVNIHYIRQKELGHAILCSRVSLGMNHLL